MLKFDVVFTDNTTYMPYDTNTLQIRPLGGSESSLIRIAEAMGSLGLKVAVLEHCLLEPSMGSYVYYLPMKYIDEIKATHHIMFRGIEHLDKLPKARKYSWHQDVGDHRFVSMAHKAVGKNVTFIAASRWHRTQLQSLAPELVERGDLKVKYVYNPLPDSLAIPRKKKIKYDRLKFVWTASPHKGLDRGIVEFKKLRDILGEDIKLNVFNPGYLPGLEGSSAFIINHGAVPCKQLWQHVSEAFCVFYPTTFLETFGCIAAEAGAVHTTVATMGIGALNETVPNSATLSGAEDYPGLLRKVEGWYRGDRPSVYANKEFLTSSVICKWLGLLS